MVNIFFLFTFCSRHSFANKVYSFVLEKWNRLKVQDYLFFKEVIAFELLTHTPGTRGSWRDSEKKRAWNGTFQRWGFHQRNFAPSLQNSQWLSVNVDGFTRVHSPRLSTNFKRLHPVIFSMYYTFYKLSFTQNKFLVKNIKHAVFKIPFLVFIYIIKEEETFILSHIIWKCK